MNKNSRPRTRQFKKLKHSNHIWPLFIVFILLGNTPSYAKTYRWTDNEGVTHFSNEPPPEAFDKPVKQKPKSPNQHLLTERESYLAKRNALLEQLSLTPQEQKRQNIQRDLNNLDIAWYDKYDPEKAKALRQKVGKAKIKVIKLKQSDENGMKRYKAFY